jgi:uncharacterized membrane protein
MALLTLAALLWIGLHIGVAGTRLRDVLVRGIGDGPFRGLFSVVSIAGLGFLVWAWRMAPTEPLWQTPAWLRWPFAALMLVAFLLFVASVTRPNPTMVGPARVASQPPRGIQRVTRHPMLWSFAIWAAVHIAANGDSADILFFGAFLVTALIGMPSIDAKLARRDPATASALMGSTSIVPFVAIAQGRNQFVPSEVGWLTVLIGVVAWALVLYLHPYAFGVDPLG